MIKVNKISERVELVHNKKVHAFITFEMIEGANITKEIANDAIPHFGWMMVLKYKEYKKQEGS